MKKASILIGLLFSLNLYGQTISERLILTDTQDSLYIKSSNASFDRHGNYCFVIKKGRQEYFVTNNDTIGGFKSVSTTFGNGGGMSDTYSYEHKEKPYYYKNNCGTNVYGTIVGEIEDYQTSNTRENIAIVTTLNDTVYYYINGKLLTKELKDPQKHYSLDQDWVSFSENDNMIYYLKQDSMYYLYLNDSKIDSSKYGYSQLAINNNGTCIFEKIGNGNPKYQFFVHSNGKVSEFTGFIFFHELIKNDAYYCTNCYLYDNIDDDKNSKKDTCYMVINNKRYENLNHLSNIILIDKNTYLYCFEEDSNMKVNVNGKIYSHDFEKIYFPTLDKLGDFAFYGLKDYYLYKFVNGKRVEDTLSKYGVRAIPLYISPQGESIHFFKTDDSIYLYRDNDLIFNPISKNTYFKTAPYKDILYNKFVRGKTENGNSLFYLEYEGQGYFVFNGKFSKPLLPIEDRYSYSSNKKGDIAAGFFNDYGFFAIQKVDDKKFIININNEIYKELDGVDYLFYDNCFFDDEGLIFYGVKGYSFYQFKLKL